MKVRRVFWVSHYFGDKRWFKKQETTDFAPEITHEEASEAIYQKYGHQQSSGYKQSYSPFAEVISSTLTEDRHRPLERAFVAPKHFGTDLLLNPVEFAGMYNQSKDRRKTRRVE